MSCETPPNNQRESLMQQRRSEAGSLGMWLFLIPEGMLFVGLLFSYEVLRAKNTATGVEDIEGNALLWLCGVAGSAVTEQNFWMPEDIKLPVYVTLANTVLLLISAYLIYRGVRSAEEGRYGISRFLLATTAAFGIAFVSIQGFEWARMLTRGLGFQEYVYGAMFYTIIGAHAVHVVGGLLFLLYCVGASLVRVPDQDLIRKLRLCRIYWFFVSFLWPVLYTFLYFE